ncbi:hypothetical protein RCL_jg3255.t1 [Rhizophagus clarus]|uniref:Uncharacterized protein n=1 Tax=Rhizophagus clarus TaxID=94130 RepID=A0A8H3R1E3_9GLOM|nr:hypothetical protein RCL_jg3255.t1 [Rhizophagus clarus]
MIKHVIREKCSTSEKKETLHFIRENNTQREKILYMTYDMAWDSTEELLSDNLLLDKIGNKKITVISPWLLCN